MVEGGDETAIAAAGREEVARATEQSGGGREQGAQRAGRWGGGRIAMAGSEAGDRRDLDAENIEVAGCGDAGEPSCERSDG